MEERIFTATHIVEVLDKCRRELTEDLQRGVITLHEEQRGASTIAAIAEKLDVFYAYALYHKKGEGLVLTDVGAGTDAGPEA